MTTATTGGRSGVRIALAPLEVRANTFVRAFTESLRVGGFDVVSYGYEPELPPGTRVVILHWPNRFFAPASTGAAEAAEQLLAAWRSARAAGTRFLWVAHNVHPHDSAPEHHALARGFIECLDGIIHLSHESPAAIHAAHRPSVARELITRHGHYRELCATPIRPWTAREDGIRLGYVGRVRPYKNLESLLVSSAEAAVPGLEVSLAGFRHDEPYAARIEALAAGRADIRLDLRSSFLSESELEAAIDDCHALVLPYRCILNSGTALLALSRDRPVLAPRLGGLEELQDRVGGRWLRLYDGDLTAATLRSFVDLLRRHDGGRCDLSAYDWGPIAAELCSFIDEVV
ncbi:MAG: hypothetical protein K8S94_03665 [Planctomycetia bacterium]|nr:hypothetical protein [Planctomycetia bacterium]